jgi:hypothetical protein
MRTVQLYATGAATASAVANVTIPSAGKIRQVIVAAMTDLVADNGLIRLELSKTANSQLTVNGAQDPFFTLALYNNLVTSGMTQGGVNQAYPLDVDVRQGELIYVHASVTTGTYYASFILFYG